MFPHQRPSPRTAAAANNLQTNPTRTNNQRDPTSERSSPYSDTGPYSDRGVEDDGEMVGRVEHVSEANQKHIQKVNQVIQVGAPTDTRGERSADGCRISLPKQHLPSFHPERYYLKASTARPAISDKTNG